MAAPGTYTTGSEWLIAAGRTLKQRQCNVTVEPAQRGDDQQLSTRSRHEGQQWHGNAWQERCGGAMCGVMAQGRFEPVDGARFRRHTAASVIGAQRSITHAPSTTSWQHSIEHAAVDKCMATAHVSLNISCVQWVQLE